MLHGTLQKMLREVAFGENLIFCLSIYHLVPGDILLSMTQLLKIDGALIVSTPQEVAMLDAIKAINAFDQLEVPLLEIIENMAGFRCPDTQHIYHIFGQGSAQELASRFNCKFGEHPS